MRTNFEITTRPNNSGAPQPFGHFGGYVQSFRGVGPDGFVPHVLRQGGATRQILLAGSCAATAMYEVVRNLPWAAIGELIAGLRLSPRGDWFECMLDDGPFGVLAWDAEGAIRIRALRGWGVSYARMSVARIPHPTPPPDVPDGGDANDLWLTWLNDNVVVEDAGFGAQKDEDREPYWLLGVGDMAHLAFVKRTMPQAD